MLAIPAKSGLFLLATAFTLALPKCFFIDGTNQPATIGVNETFTIEVDMRITGKDGSTLVFGFLAPRAWRAAEHTTVSFTSNVGNGAMIPMPPDERELDNNEPWAQAITRRAGFGQNYGEVEWIVFKAVNAIEPPASTNETNPVTGKIRITTRAGTSNLITQLGYFAGDALWGYLNDGNNSVVYFDTPCIEVTGASGQAQNLCGPPPRRLVQMDTYTFNDLLTIIFDAKEDSTALMGAQEVYFCSRAIYENGESEVCEVSAKTEMRLTGPDFWTLTLWPPSFYNLPPGSTVSEILCTFQDASGNVIVKDASGNDFQMLVKCFN